MRPTTWLVDVEVGNGRVIFGSGAVLVPAVAATHL